MSVANPSSFLDLVQRFAVEVGIADDGPTTVLSQTGESARLVNAVATAWIDLQKVHPDWGFLLVTPGVSFTTIAGQALYTPTQAGVLAGAVGQWRRESFRCYHTSTGQSSEIYLTYIPYDQWRDLYQYGSLRTTRVQPTVMTVLPNFSLGLQTPLEGYTITGEYYAAPVQLALDADIPTIPSQHIMGIVYLAMMTYGGYESAGEVYQIGQQKFNLVRAQMEKDRLIEITPTGAMA